MRYRTSCLIVMVVVGLLSGCTLNVNQDSGRVVSESREISDVQNVSFSGAGALTITQGETESLTIETSDTIMPSIVTDVEDGELSIRFRDTVLSTEAIKFDLTVQEINTLTIAGAGDIEAVDITTDQFTVDLSGAADIDIRNLEADDLTIELSGTGSVNASGAAANQSIRLSGLGNYAAANLESNEASVQVTGAGGAVLWVHDMLDVKISGAGEVEYYGTPTVTSDISGIGNLSDKGEKPEPENEGDESEGEAQ
jgi:hypothetical protein